MKTSRPAPAAAILLLFTTATGAEPARHVTPAARSMEAPHLEIASFAEQNTRTHAAWSQVVMDVARHLPSTHRYDDAFRRYMQEGDLVTAAHEWTHFLNEHLSLEAGVGISAYYVLENRYVTLSDPEGLRGIVPEVPPSLRGDLYDLYLVQNAGNARVDPLYLLDEWTAYTNDVVAAVDLLSAGKGLHVSRRTLQTSTAANVLEFTFYACAVGMAVKQHDPAYYASRQGEKLRAFIAWNGRRAMAAYTEAAERDELSRGDARNVSLVRSFRTSADSAALRAWVRSDLGGELADALLGVESKIASARRYTLNTETSRTPAAPRRAG